MLLGFPQYHQSYVKQLELISARLVPLVLLDIQLLNKKFYNFLSNPLLAPWLLALPLNHFLLLLGFIDLFEIDFTKSQAGISILISNSENRSKGYGKLSVKKICEYARKELKIKNLYCNISVDNILSLNFFKSVGFKEISKNNNLYVSSIDNHHESIIQMQCI